MGVKRPSILLLVNNRGWAFDVSAQQIRKNLANDFDFDIAYIREKPIIDRNKYALVFTFFWGDTYHNRFNIDRQRLIKNISSHRWEYDPKFGPYRPQDFVGRYLSDAAAVSCTSIRLFNMIRGLRPHVYHTPNGYDPAAFFDKQKRNGALTVGWAGAPQDNIKGYYDILEPACKDTVILKVAGGNLQHTEMNNFYNEIDVLAVSSKYEGEPLPLIESMAAGCFPVCTDVGIVPELVQSGANGLIVKRSQADFRTAFRWCASNLDLVRQAGRANADQMRRERTWPACIPHFRKLFIETIDRTKP